MRVVIALGGNALLKRGEVMSAENQLHNVKHAASAIGQIIADGHEVIVTHGNGPQIGLLALQNAAVEKAQAQPLDIMGAETDGMIGYMIEQELGNVLSDESEVAVLLTQIEVDPADPAFNTPSKPIGPIYSKNEAEVMAAQNGWQIMPDGMHYRRAVASPQPQRILELNAIRLLVEHDVTVICAGGGGIPVVRCNDGAYRGVEAVIDKDHASRLLANEVKADALIMLTDIDGVYLGWGTAQRKRIQRATPAEMKSYAFAAGSMEPKVRAAIDFVNNGGEFAGIGRLEDASEILKQNSGTIIAN
jgi:carbamate kinase